MAADVSPTQNVEMLNEGIFVYDKSGNPLGNKSLYQFWCGSPGADGNPLPACAAIANHFVTIQDTQIVYDSYDQRWLGTTLLTDDNRQTGDLLFAISTGTSALDGSGVWERYDIQGICGANAGNYIFPDQPILGYSSNWAAVDTICFGGAIQNPPNTDALVLIPDSAIKIPPKTLNPTIITPPLYASRASRDISGSGNPYSQLVLASSQFNTNTQPDVALYGIGASPSATPIGISPTSWGFSGGGSDFIPPAPQTGCTVQSSNCMINAADQGRIQQVTVQYNPKTLKHYLLTSFTAGYQSGAEVLYYIDELESGTWAGEFTGTGNTGWVPTYTTITSDQDFDINATLTSFTSNGCPSSLWLSWHEFQGLFGPNEISFAGSAAAYTGRNTCPTATPTGSLSPTPSPSATSTPAPTLQRWGDYNSLIWDPSLTSSSGEQGLFWSVLEFTKGATDQSIVWTQFNDTLPYFVGYSVPVSTEDGTVGEDECSNGSGFNCNLSYTAPAGSQFGDVFVATIYIGEATDATYLTLPTGWTALKDQFGTRGLVSSDAIGSDTSFVALYVYGSQPNDTGTYKLKIDPKTNGSEVIGFMVAYRGASANIPGNYVLNGNPGSGSGNIVTTNKLSPNNNNSPAGESTLLYLFDEDCVTTGAEEPDAYPLFSSPSGPSHKLTSETPFTSRSGIFAADVAVPTSGGTYGPYNEGLNCQSLSFSYSLVIPEN